MTASRVTWDETWMAVARAVGLRSPCFRDKIGAVVVDRDNRIVDTGYNGPPRGMPRDEQTDCRSWCPRATQTGSWRLPAVTTQPLPNIAVEDGQMSFEWGGKRFPVTDETFERLGATKIRDPSYDDCSSLHAEANALMFSDRRLREGGTIYVTSPTCYACAKLVANSGLETIVNVAPREIHAHRDPQRSIDFMEKCGLTVVTL